MQPACILDANSQPTGIIKICTARLGRTGEPPLILLMRHTRLVLDIYLACTRYHAFLQPDTSSLPFFRFLIFHLHTCALARHFSEHSNLFPSFFCSIPILLLLIPAALGFIRLHDTTRVTSVGPT
ncbi:hypothetical protein GE21DRAFT_1135107 [Neurospora crassa]|nr:hypothetical protein GE21DRAFT_1135107 [Neurospora crassa]